MWLKADGGKVSFINLEEGLSTTNIIEKIRKLYQLQSIYKKGEFE